jgi:hypothetical protein
MRKARFVVLGLGAALIFVGCNSRKSFEPDETSSASSAVTKTGKEAVSVMRDGVTFSDGTFLTRSGIGNIRLPEGFHYVTQSSRYVLSADDSGKIVILDRKNGKKVQETKLDFPLISALIRGNSIYYISQDDQFGLYDISAKKTTISAKVGRAFAVDTRIANPIPFQGLLLVPTLDGKLLLINPRNPRGARGFAIGNQYNLNNIIYLRNLGRRIIAATPRKLVSAAPGAMHKFEAPIADVAISGNTIYALTGDGRIVRLSPSLKVLAQKKFPYAQFAAIAVAGGKIYALDRSGALIVTDSTFRHSRVYDVGGVDNYAFVSGSRLYKDDEVIDLGKLGY